MKTAHKEGSFLSAWLEKTNSGKLCLWEAPSRVILNLVGVWHKLGLRNLFRAIHQQRLPVGSRYCMDRFEKSECLISAFSPTEPLRFYLETHIEMDLKKKKKWIQCRCSILTNLFQAFSFILSAGKTSSASVLTPPLPNPAQHCATISFTLIFLKARKGIFIFLLLFILLTQEYWPAQNWDLKKLFWILNSIPRRIGPQF